MKAIEIKVLISIVMLLAGMLANKSVPVGSTDRNPAVTETQTDDIDPEEMSYIQYKAIKANDFLYESFEWGESDYIYPDDFAGTYIDYDTLHVLLTDKSAIPKYSKLLADYSEYVTFDIVKYSYNELYALNEKCFNELKDNNFSVTGCYVDVKKNRGIVEVLPEDLEKAVAYAAEHFDGDNIEIEGGQYVVLD